MNKIPTVLGLALATISLAAAAAPAAPPADKGAWTVSHVNDCAAKNLVNKGALRDLSAMPTDREGKTRTLKMRFFWKPTPKGEPRISLRLTEPLAIAGSAYLLTVKGGQEDVHFYFPGADRALKITGKNMSEPLWGTDVSYGEIKQVLGLVATTQAQRQADATVGDRKAFVLETKSADGEGYSRVLSYIDQQTCVLLKSEFFEKGDKPRKTLVADQASILAADTYWLVLGYTMNDLREGTKTELVLSDFSIMERLPERLFDPKRFFEPFE